MSMTTISMTNATSKILTKSKYYVSLFREVNDTSFIWAGESSKLSIAKMQSRRISSWCDQRRLNFVGNI